MAWTSSLRSRRSLGSLRLSRALATVAAALLLGAAPGLAKTVADWKKDYKALETKKDWAGAKTLLGKALKEHPKDAWLNVYMGHTLRQQSDFAGAAPYYDTALAAAPSDKGVVDNYVSGYTAYGNDLAFSKQKWADAAKQYDKAVKASPNAAGTANAWNVYGNCLRVLGKHKDAYKAFDKFYALAPAKAADEGYKANFRTGVLEGMPGLRKANDIKGAAAYGELGHKAYPADGDIKAALLDIYVALDDKKKIDELSAGASPAEKALNDGIAFLAKNKDVDAAKSFKTASETPKADFSIDDRIAKAYRTKVETLPYTSQMSSPYQDQVVAYATKAVTKYFAAKPYKGAPIVSPLKEPYCVGQGAGGKSYHYGLTGHYAFDLVGCNGAAIMGKDIVAVRDGTVKTVVAGNPDRADGAPVDLKAQGNYIVIKHGDVESHYVHIKKGSAKVAVGASVKAGQVIASVGNSGVTTGPHLHFMMVKNGGALGNVTVPVSFSGLYRIQTSAAKPGVALKAATGLDMGYTYAVKSTL